MNIKDLHPWGISCGQAVALQQALAERLILFDHHLPDPIRSIAGADISYARQSDLFFASVVVLSFPGLELIEEASFIERVTFPYVPGLLSFREGPPLLKAFGRLKRKPDVVIFDGQGIAHPRGVGLASHMGLFLDRPTIGCAKKRLVGCHEEVGTEARSVVDLVYRERVVGAVVRTKSRVRPVYVSSGHRIGLGKAVSIILACCNGYRLPEPTRKAHLAVNRIRMNEGFSVRTEPHPCR